MRIPASFRNAAAVVFGANSVANPTALTPSLPTRVNGDLLLCFTACRSITATAAISAGWTLLTGFPLTSGTASGGRVYVYARISDATDAAPTVTWTGVGTGTTGDVAHACILSYQNVYTDRGAAGVLDGAVAASDQAASTTAVTAPAITTLVQNSIRIGYFLKWLETSGTWTAPAAGGWTERVDATTTNAVGNTLEIADVAAATPGVLAAVTAAPSVTTSSRAYGVSLAILSAYKQVSGGVNYQNPAALMEGMEQDERSRIWKPRRRIWTPRPIGCPA